MVGKAIYKGIHRKVKFMCVNIDIINYGARVFEDSSRKLYRTEKVKGSQERV